jgi:hypothetical protein
MGSGMRTPKNEYAIPKLYDYKSFNVKLSARL